MGKNGERILWGKHFRIGNFPHFSLQVQSPGSWSREVPLFFGCPQRRHFVRPVTLLVHLLHKNAIGKR